MYKHVYTEPPSPRQVRADLPETLERVILRCLKKSPDERFSTAAELSLQLQILAQTLRGGALGIQTFVPGASQPTDGSTIDRSGGFRLTFDSDHQILIPGQPGVVTATLTSKDDAQLEIKLALEDVPPTWLSAPLLNVLLEPGAQQSVALPVLVPRTPDFRAGDYRVTLKASDQKSPGHDQSASAVWSVAQFDEVEFELIPSQSSGWTGARFNISLSNRGNSATRVELNSTVSEPSFSTETKRPIVDLDPGESIRTKVRVRVGACWIGGRSGAVTVEARLTGAQALSDVFTFTQRPLLPFLVPVVALFLIGGFLGGLFLLGRGGSATDSTPTA